MEKENEGVNRNLCLLRNGFVDGQAKSNIVLVLVCFFERKKEKGKKWAPVEMGTLSLRRKPCHLCFRERVTGVPGHRGKSGEGGCFSLFFYQFSFVWWP